ncbi:MAG: hypothetical protein ACE141_12005 [Bryobacteraceae bacterium]
MKKQSKKATSQPVKRPADEVREFLAEQKALYTARDSAERRVAEAEKNLDTARRNLAAAQAERLIQDPDADLDGMETSAEFVSASLRLEECRAAQGGIRKRIADRDAQLLTIAAKLKSARQQYNAEAIQRFLTDTYTPAAEAFARVLRRGAALEAALGEPIPALHCLPEHEAWSSDTEAREFHDQHCELRNLNEALIQYQRDAEARVLMAEKDRMRKAPFDPTAKFKVRKPFVCMGKEYAVGSLVDAHDIALTTLGKLHGAGFLTTVEHIYEWEA